MANIDDALSILGGGQVESPAQGSAPAADNGAPTEGYYDNRLHVTVPARSAKKALDVLSGSGAPSATAPPADIAIKPDDKISTGRAVWAGAKQGATFGFADELAGILAAAGYGAAPQFMGNIDELKSLSPQEGMERFYTKIVPEAYAKARDAQRAETEQAQKQHPTAYMAGNVGAALAMPLGSSVRAASWGVRALRSARTGAIVGGLTGVGEGTDTESRLKGGAYGAGGGAALGVAIPAAQTAIGAPLKFAADKTGVARIPELYRAWRDPGKIAAQKIVSARGADANVGGLGLNQQDIEAARLSGQPTVLADTGGETTRALARSAANESPAGRSILENAIGPRYKQQADRTANFLDSLMGGSVNSTETREGLQQSARASLKPLYEKAYAAGSGGLWSPELERLTGSPAVVDALRAAAIKGKDRAIADRFGAFNPNVKVTDDGRLLFGRGGGMPAHPDLQFWDYTMRELRDSASAAFRAGRSEEGGRLNGLATDMRAELDKLVPEFGAARSEAAKFFGAQDALEAGGKFAAARGQNDAYRQVIAKMKPAERVLFADGFASKIISSVRETADRQNIVNQIYNSPAARERINMALGAQKAGELEMFLRRENIMDKLRQAMGNSTTKQQLMEHGMAGAAGIGIAGGEAFLSGELDTSKVMQGLAAVAVLEGRGAISRKLAQTVAEKLSSTNPKEWESILRMGAQNPKVRSVVRTIESAVVRAAGEQAGNAAARDVAAPTPVGNPPQ